VDERRPTEGSALLSLASEEGILYVPLFHTTDALVKFVEEFAYTANSDVR
jgi:hypothetical protein